MTAKSVLLNAIRIDGGTQARTAIDMDVVAEYREVIKAGGTLPPAVVFFDGAENWLAGGFHRYHAHIGEGKASMACDVRAGTLRDAILFACGDNADHGLRRSNADKRKAIGMMLDDAEWSKLADREIARLCAVSHPLVGQVRAERAAPPPTTPPSPPVTGGGAGNSSSQKKAGEKKAAPAPQPPAAPAPAPAADDEGAQIADDAHGDDDLAESLASAERECKELREQIAAAEADDTKAEAMKFQRLWSVASRRQQELQQVIGDREAELRKYVGWMKRIGKAVGEDDPANIAATVEMFVRNAKVGA